MLKATALRVQEWDMFRSVLVVTIGLVAGAPGVRASVLLVSSERTVQAASRIWPAGGAEVSDADVQTTYEPGLFDRTGNTSAANPGLPGLFSTARVEHTSLVTPTLIAGVSQMFAHISPPLPAPHQFDLRDGGVASVLDATFDVAAPTPYSLSASIWVSRSLLSTQRYLIVALLDGNGLFIHSAEINPNSGINEPGIDLSGVLSPGRYRLVASAGTNLDGDSPFDPGIIFDAGWSVTLAVLSPGSAVWLLVAPMLRGRRPARPVAPA